ncbi:unnamed protein product [Soboliphyme baturini]|uniref:Molybdopterin synthase sulfur carrier subunit n=1 Tax=Soboliphyme baturini TaxID=241478 RepID=A0A183IG81_9BILA|nr:unnamed protein product [Soboliphyme baturini]
MAIFFILAQTVVIASKIFGKELVEYLTKTFPALRDVIQNCLIAVNMEYIADMHANLKLFEGIEIAVMPPFSGG